MQIALRALALALVLYAIAEATRNLVGYSVLDIAPIFQQLVGFSLVPVIWLALAVALVLCERWLLNWLVPTPRPGCPSCGYSLHNLKSPVCPECGTDLPRPRS